jgi:hypothetical protein
MITFILAQLISLHIGLAFDKPDDPSVTGFRLYRGNQSGVYTNTIDLGMENRVIATGLASNTIYFFAVTSHDNTGMESIFSNEVTYQTQNVRPVSLTLSPRGIITINSYAGARLDIEKTSDLATPFKVWKSFTATNSVELFGTCLDGSSGFFRLRDRTEEIIPLKTKEQILTEALRSAIAKEQMQSLVPKISSTELLAPSLRLNSTSVGAAVMRKRYRSADTRKGAELLMELRKR